MCRVECFSVVDWSFCVYWNVSVLWQFWKKRCKIAASHIFYIKKLQSRIFATFFKFCDFWWNLCVCRSLSVLWLKDFVCAEFFSQSTKAFELATVFQCFWLKLLCVPKSFSGLTEGFWGRIFYGFGNIKAFFARPVTV